MIKDISHQSCQLTALMNSLPVKNSYKSISEINLILARYIKILDYVNSYNPEYKSATRVYYADITSIRDSIQQLLIAESKGEKDRAFECAVNELKTDLYALAMLITPEGELA